MKAIIIKINGQVVSCEQLSEVSTKKFIDLQKEAKINLQKYENGHNEDLHKMNEIVNFMHEIDNKIENLQQEIKVIKGEDEE